MRKHIKMQALILAVVLLVGAVLYGFLYQADNKYTSALPGGYGYNVLPNDLEQVSFLVEAGSTIPVSFYLRPILRAASSRNIIPILGSMLTFLTFWAVPTERQPTV